MTTIKPIETHYAGHRFRSRLEARWAVFLDAMEIPWQYAAARAARFEHGERPSR